MRSSKKQGGKRGKSTWGEKYETQEEKEKQGRKFDRPTAM